MHSDAFAQYPGYQILLTDGKETVPIILSDSKGVNDPLNISRAPLTRTAMQTSSGTQKYSDLEPPWISVSQDDFTGGRANEDFTDDSTRFFDSKRCNTGFPTIFNGQLDYYATGFKKAVTNYPGSVSWRKAIESSSKNIAIKFIPSETFVAGQIYILLRRRGTPSQSLSVTLCNNSIGIPGTILASHNYTVEEITDTLSDFTKFTFSGITLSADSIYWIKISSSEGTSNDHWEIGTINPYTGTDCYDSLNGTTWAECDYAPYYRVSESVTGYKPKFFLYKNAAMCIYQQDTGAPRLFINGDIANVTSATSTVITCSSKSWAAGKWAGAQVGIINGMGTEAVVSCWRTITDNATATITVSESFSIVPDSTSRIVITNTPIFTEITGHGITNHVTDILVFGGIVYFCQGDYTTIRKMRWDSAGWIFASETEKAMFLKEVRSKDGVKLWKANNYDSNGEVSIAYSMATDWMDSEIILCSYATAITPDTGLIYSDSVDFTKADVYGKTYALTITTMSSDKNTGTLIVKLQQSDDNVIFSDVGTFPYVYNQGGTTYLRATCTKRYRRVSLLLSGTNASITGITVTTLSTLKFEVAQVFRDNYGLITGLAEYGPETTKNLWIFREGMVFSNIEERYDRFNLDEMGATMDEHNGSSWITGDVYLYFTWMNGIQRYYNSSLDSEGLDKDAGLPEDRAGRVTSLLSYPARYFAATDAGSTGYSTIHMNNGNGWNEAYRAPNKGERIYSMMIQPTMGNVSDRLWFNCNDDVLWLVMPSKTINPYNDPNIEYTHESVIVSSWHYCGMSDIIKTWNSIKLLTENLDDDSITIEGDYQVDTDENWTPLDSVYTESPSEKILLMEIYGVHGKRLRYRLRLQTADKTKTARIKAVVIEAIGRVDVKYSYSFPYRNLEKGHDLTGQMDVLLPSERQEILDKWVSDATALRMSCVKRLYDDKRIYLEAISLATAWEKDEGYVGRITANEI